MSGLSPRIDTIESQVAVAGVTYVGNASGESGTTGYTVYSERKTFTVTIASPGVVTLNAHGYSNGDAVVLSTTGALPTGLSVNTVYYVVSAGTNTFSLASSIGGTAINTSGAQSGVHTVGPLVPHVGTGGVASTTFTVSNINPLRGLQSFVLSKDAANRGGEGVSYNFTIDRADLARVLTVSFEYQVLSGTLADGDLDIYLIQDPNGTPVIIQPAGFTVMGASAGVKMKHSATFQTDFTAREYRLCIHVGSASVAAFSVGVDSIAVGPQKVLAGAAISDWQSYTPTFAGIGTATGVNFKYRRSGDTIQVTGAFQTGTPTAVQFTVSLPYGTIDAAKINENATIGNLTRQTTANQAASVLARTGLSTSVVYVGGEYQNVGQLGLSPQNGSSLFGPSEYVTLEFFYPAAGLSSNTVMSQDTDTRVVAARANSPSITGFTSTPTNPVLNNKLFDTHAAYNTSTGVYSVPVSGYYKVTYAGRMANLEAMVSGTTAGTYIFKNSSLDTIMGTLSISAAVTPSNGFHWHGSGIVYANAGDTLEIRNAHDMGGTKNLLSAAANGALNWVSFERLSGPATIAASETVAMLYTGAPPTGSIGPSLYTVTMGTKVTDSHNAYSSGEYTIPVSGRYSISASVAVAGGRSVGNLTTCSIIIDNVEKYVNYYEAEAAVTGTPVVQTSITSVPLLAGQKVKLGVFTQASTPSYSSSANSNYLSIIRVGN